MKKEENTPIKLESLSEAHEAMGLPKPQHPLISILNNMDNQRVCNFPSNSHVLSYYKISYKPKFDGKIRYGQTFYDFNEGGLLFAAPNQVLGCSSDVQRSQISDYTLLIHPDFLWNYPLAKKIKQYSFFSYSANEALHLSDQEKETIISIFRIIEEELHNRIDEFSQEVLISQIELLLNYANRFYKRQFITRKVVSNDLLQKLEEILDGYFANQKSLQEGIPTVQYLSDNLNVSPSYLSDMLRSLTGQNAQQHIHNKLIEKAKERLSVTTLSISEIGYELGFEHPQSFSRLFKLKTNLSPVEFRRSFN